MCAHVICQNQCIEKEEIWFERVVLLYRASYVVCSIDIVKFYQSLNQLDFAGALISAKTNAKDTRIYKQQNHSSQAVEVEMKWS